MELGSWNGPGGGSNQEECLAGSFVNSAVTVLFTKPLASWFPPFHYLPGTSPSFHCSNREAVNGGMGGGGGRSCRRHFWERLVTKGPAALSIAL